MLAGLVDGAAFCYLRSVLNDLVGPAQMPLFQTSALRLPETPGWRGAVVFDTSVAILVLDDLAVWQKLNVTAFLPTGIAGAAPEAVGEPYEDAAGHQHARLLGQSMLVFAAGLGVLWRAYRQAITRELTRAVYVRAMFATGHNAANRAAFQAEPADAPDLVGLALRGPRKEVDKAMKGAVLHP